jgi:hypothetical protein
MGAWVNAKIGRVQKSSFAFAQLSGIKRAPSFLDEIPWTVVVLVLATLPSFWLSP